MELSGFNKIVNTLGDALGVFDFSFFISGFTTFSFLMVELHKYIPDIINKLKGWETIVILILVIYVCGLMSWAIGKRIRCFFLCFKHMSLHGIKEDLKDVMQKTQKGLDINKTSKDYETIYSKMWVDLSMNENGRNRIGFINQMWVKKAVFEGLISSWLVGFVVTFDVDSYQTLLNLKADSCLPCILRVVLLLLMIVSAHMGTEYARSQIKDVVVAHHELCK